MSASRVYERAVVRPFAEQLVDAAQVRPRHHVAELLPRSDMLALALAALAPGAAALPVRDDAEMSAVAADAALALFTITAEHADLARAAASRMRTTLLAWPPRGDQVAATSPPLEHLLASAMQAAGADIPGALVAALDTPQLEGWDTVPCTDVCRFDSVEELATATCAWHGIALEPASASAVVDHLAAALEARTGFDGTLRVPVTALLLQSR